MKTSLVLLLATIVLLLLSACATPSQIMVDAEVRRLCEKDGGIKVYETVKLPAERFNEYGQIRIPYKEITKPEDDYYYESLRTFLETGYTQVWRSHIKVYRNTDKKIIGEAISYARRGGDVPGPWHSSSFRCSEEAGLNNLKNQIFIKY